MEIVEQIVKSRKNLKEILKDEYDTDSLPIYELEEMDKLFELETTKDNPFKTSSNSGKGNACNFTLNHKSILNHKLHIVYYNLQKDGKTKMMKNTIWKYIDKLYESETFQKTDNVFLIINEPFKETIKNMNHELNLELKEKYKDKIDNDLGYTSFWSRCCHSSPRWGLLIVLTCNKTPCKRKSGDLYANGYDPGDNFSYDRIEIRP